ncbi:hypothetical protein BLNAU_14165 [Blattamonas nauphoetae]|uniref:RING-type domain-containing protein n=1 Tax=Blattamonas nauphoetae TaxID=2049346 RepID=A0ABQ9XEG4_9EUKA|nr:hypothetical protein BLNAU_14165 [Blattamonas nauphoetae]
MSSRRKPILTSDGTQIADVVSCLTCPICHKLLTNPYTIQDCMHSFCYDCITAHFEDSKQCPVCSEYYPGNPLSILVKDSLLGSLSEKVKKTCSQVTGLEHLLQSEP